MFTPPSNWDFLWVYRWLFFDNFHVKTCMCDCVLVKMWYKFFNITTLNTFLCFNHPTPPSPMWKRCAFIRNDTLDTKLWEFPLSQHNSHKLNERLTNIYVFISGHVRFISWTGSVMVLLNGQILRWWVSTTK